jgi:hypothetical protein
MTPLGPGLHAACVTGLDDRQPADAQSGLLADHDGIRGEIRLNLGESAGTR